jgi:hypothetical protein
MRFPEAPEYIATLAAFCFTVGVSELIGRHQPTISEDRNERDQEDAVHCNRDVNRIGRGWIKYEQEQHQQRINASNSDGC